jgi:hypothetical protein
VCPYDSLAPANLAFCERRLCSWIVEPANAWTNVGFVIVGLAILRLARRDRVSLASWLGPIAIATGLASFAYHATGTLLGQLFDQGVMFLETALFIAIDARRLRPRMPVLGLYLAIVTASIAALVAWPTAGIALFAAHAVAFAVLEVICYRRARAPSYRFLAIALALFVASQALWQLDLRGPLCDPDNHLLTAHGGWHLLGALTFLFYYLHFAAAEATSRTP